MWPVILPHFYRNIAVRDAFEIYQFGYITRSSLPQSNFRFVPVLVKLRKKLWLIFLHLDRQIYSEGLKENVALAG